MERENSVAKRKEAEDIIWSVCGSFGYEEVEPSIVKDGKICLSRDICEIIAENVGNGVMPKRYCAASKVYREENGEIKESAQYVAELIGAETSAADAELIAMSTEALIALGIEDFYIKIGSNSFVKALCEEAAGENAEALFSALKAGDDEAVRELLAEYDGELKPLIPKLKGLDENSEELDLLQDVSLPEKACDALDNLTELYMLLTLYGLEKYPKPMPGSMGDERYGDMFFEIYADGSDVPVVYGGIREKSAQRTAEGVFLLDEIVKITSEDYRKISKTLIFAESAASGPAYDIAYNLRVNGCIAEGYVGEGSCKDAEKYAEEIGAECMIRVFADGKIQIKDFSSGEITETYTDEFLGYYEDTEGDGCDCEDEDCGCHHHNH